MSEKPCVAVLCGGKSAEHEISLISAQNILKSIPPDRYHTLLIGIDREGKWWEIERDTFLEIPPDPKTIALPSCGRQVAVIPGGNGSPFLYLDNGEILPPVSVVFPILHGPLGEDGTLQGMMRQLNIAFVGPDSLASGVSMDKDMTKRLLTHAGIANSRFKVFHRHLRDHISFGRVSGELGLPLYIKPANMGSSVGISRARTEEEFNAAIDLAFRFDTKIVIEEQIIGREIECAVLGNKEFLRASVPGEVIPKDGFYSYESKYIDEKGAALEMPAKNLSQADVAEIRDMALHTFRVLGCEGLARVDFFLQQDGKLLVNEVNTLPGFTSISMYPKLWELTGVPPVELVSDLIHLAISRQHRWQELEAKM